MITPPCAVMSNIRAAGKPQTKTVKDPNAITSGGPTHVNMSVTRACGSPPVRTVIAQGGRMGPPTCGTSTVSIGQTCMSVARAAGNMISTISRLGLQRKPAGGRASLYAQTSFSIAPPGVFLLRHQALFYCATRHAKPIAALISTSRSRTLTTPSPVRSFVGGDIPNTWLTSACTSDTLIMAL